MKENVSLQSVDENNGVGLSIHTWAWEIPWHGKEVRLSRLPDILLLLDPLHRYLVAAALQANTEEKAILCVYVCVGVCVWGVGWVAGGAAT